MNHPLHIYIANILNDIKPSGCEIIFDPACEQKGSHNIPLFINLNKSNSTEFCNVDVLIIRNNEIKVIVEIDESDIKPTQIMGKFLTSAMSKYYIHENNNSIPISKSDHVLFIQFIDISRSKDNSKKEDQLFLIEQSIKQIIPIKATNITHYLLLPVNTKLDSDKKKLLKRYIRYIIDI